jgi:hypothetical protein
MSAVLMFLLDHPAAFWGLFLVLVGLAVYGMDLIVQTAEANDSARHSVPAPKATVHAFPNRVSEASPCSPRTDRQEAS